MDASPQQICAEVLNLLEHVKRSVLALAEAQGLTQVQAFSLYIIDRHGDVNMGQVADVLHCDASNVTGIVNRLVAQGLVERHAYESDRRSKKLQLTKKGKAVVDTLQSALPARLHCDKLSAEERHTLLVIIGKMCAPA